jgi:hypothetical protein
MAAGQNFLRRTIRQQTRTTSRTAEAETRAPEAGNGTGENRAALCTGARGASKRPCCIFHLPFNVAPRHAATLTRPEDRSLNAERCQVRNTLASICFGVTLRRIGFTIEIR